MILDLGANLSHLKCTVLGIVHSFELFISYYIIRNIYSNKFSKNICFGISKFLVIIRACMNM